jgi:hypothetical protein
LSVRVSGEYAVPDGELSLHRLTLVMKSSEGVAGGEKVKRERKSGDEHQQ